MEDAMKRLWINEIDADRKEWEALLLASGLRPEQSITETYGIYEGEELIASASFFDNIIKCVAIKEEYRGGAVFNELISEMSNLLFRNGHNALYVYTKPSSEKAFSSLGFRTIERSAPDLVFMESAGHGFSSYLEELRAQAGSPSLTAGAIVMNANPFTKGHLHLVREALKHCDLLHLFIVSENRSVFDFSVRARLVKEGTRGLGKILYHETASYLVSSATFPAYFLKEDSSLTEIQARLDARIFKYHIAPALHIDVRFVGEEPFSPPTRMYNEAMEKEFEGSPRLHVIPRLSEDGHIISASEVRAMLSEGRLFETASFLPASTYRFLCGKEAEPILKKLKADRLKGAKASDLPLYERI